MVLLKLLALFASFLVLAYAAPDADLVSNLPGLNFNPNFVSYSGYLRAASTRQYHYWFVTHQFNSSSSPVILWLNGGPGCSSLGGLIEELGPFHISDNGSTVYENPFAWNKVGHVIFLESPAGVGFSYATDGNTATDDDQVAMDNYNSLVDFFTRKFPELKNQNFYITGESYGGVYIPTLAVLVAQDKTNFPNFKGVAIGNGYYNVDLNDMTIPGLLYQHGLVRQNLWNQLSTQCCNGDPYNCDYDSFNQGTQCYNLADSVFEVDYYDVDPYNLYEFCYLDGGHKTNKRTFIYNTLIKNRRNKRAKFGKKAKPQNAAGLPLCAQDANTETYLNRPEVRTALHIPDTVPHWTDCSDEVGFQYNQIYTDMTPVFQKLIQLGVRIMTYNGDVDTVCNIILNERFIDNLNLTYIGGVDSIPWTYTGLWNDPAAYFSNVVGMYIKFQENVDFVSVRGSGHFVPEDRPREALQMIYNYVNNLDYSTPVPFSVAPQPTGTPVNAA